MKSIDQLRVKKNHLFREMRLLLSFGENQYDALKNALVKFHCI